MLFLSSALSWAGAHVVLLTFAIIIACSIITALTPVRFRHARWYGWIVRFNDRISVLTHPDALGTLKLPLLASAISPQMAAALAVAQSLTVPGATPQASPQTASAPTTSQR
jgi:hypothetical protein